jgi:hypothetical protein
MREDVIEIGDYRYMMKISKYVIMISEFVIQVSVFEVVDECEKM